MAKEKSVKPELLFIYLFFILFPFGQLLRQEFLLLGKPVVFQPIDAVAGMSLIYFLLGRLRADSFIKPVYTILIYTIFSLITSLSIFKIADLVRGILYLVRLFSYFTFYLLVLKGLYGSKYLKKRLLDIMVIASVFTAIFGWVQYLRWPDLRSLKFIGWDDHLYRLTGTFLDPTFTAVLLSFGVLAAYSVYLRKRSNTYLAASILLAASVLFTYARAGYLSLLCGFIYMLGRKKYKFSLLISSVFVFSMLVLPRPSGFGVRLERTHSIVFRFQNYKEGLAVFRNSPVFGIGYNNICAWKEKYPAVQDSGSHACSGFDSSFLVVLVTFGIAGLLISVPVITKMITLLKTKRNDFSNVFKACLVAISVHSLFVNSAFYPWVMGWLASLYALARSSGSKTD